MSEIKVNKISPSSGTAFTIGDSGDTFTVPSGATIVNSGTATGFGGGKIGQVLTVQNLDVESTTSTSFATIPDLSVSITPVATTSKIFVMSSLTLGYESIQALFRLYRDSTNIGLGTPEGNRLGASFSVGDMGTTLGYFAWVNTFNWLDSPATTSAIAYTWQWKIDTGEQYLNRTDDASDAAYYIRTPSSITVMEVLA